MSKTDALLEKLVARISAAPTAEDSTSFCPAMPRVKGMDEITRASHIRLIRSIAKAYRQHGFDLLVHQATLGKLGLDDLSDDELIALHRDFDRARECVSEGITFEIAGLIRSVDY